ncbi:MAG: hypothetical protein MR278_01820 [Bacteroidales bacterium]|nr:hypothetical protein [Anaerotignum sp.]MCI5678713.1 hypothetical protein [Bacteroidales bacterium]MDY3925927.1 hypothetical protein [Anaerotignum sp.]
MPKLYEVLHDPKKYIESFLYIKTKKNEIVRFRLNSAQKRLYDLIMGLQEEGRPVRIIILKSRQMGFSTLTEALIYYKTATRKNVNSFIITHKDEATTNLFNMSKLYQEKNQVRPMLKTSNAKELLFENPTKNQREKERRPGLKSKIKCSTAGGKGVGRSDTLTNAHLSEIAFWPGDIGETYSGLMQAVPDTPESMVIIESTAKGFNFFKKMWDDAVAGENDYVPFFAAWFEMEEYRRPYHGETLTAEEEELKALFGLDNEQIMWRRWCIRNNCNNDIDVFHQEYPATPEEAFIASGTCVFKNNREIVLRIRMLQEEAAPRRGSFTYTERVAALDRIFLSDWQFEESEKGEISIFREPVPGRPYVLGGDTAGEGSDWFSAHVIDNITGEQVARLHWQNPDGDDYAKQVYCLGMYYNRALIALEMNFDSHPQKVLEYLGYPNFYVREKMDTYTGKVKQSYGFRTDSVSRPVLVGKLIEYVRDYLHLIHDRETLMECLSFIRNDNGRAEAEQGEHDDLLMGLGVALMARGQGGTKDESTEAKEKKVKWTEDQWEDYWNANEEGKKLLVSKWGEPM